MNNEIMNSNHGIVAQYPFNSVTPIQMRFNDVDALGHLNNSVYFEFFDLAKSQYFLGLNVQSEIDWCQPAIIIANINCSFLAQTHHNERVEVLTQCTHLGNKSLTILQHLVNSDTREVKCTCSTIMVNLDPATGNHSPIPQVWRDAITAYEGHEID